MKLKKSALAKALANRDTIDEQIKRQTGGGGGDLKPLMGQRELKVKECRYFGDDDKHLSVRCFIDGLKVCADYTFFNINTDQVHERVLSSFISFMALLGFTLDNDNGFFVKNGTDDYIENLDQDKGGIIGKQFSGIVFASGEHDGYTNYSVSSHGKPGNGSSFAWLKSQWEWSVMGVDKDGNKVSDNPFYSYSASVKGGWDAYINTAYDIEDFKSDLHKYTHYGVSDNINSDDKADVKQSEPKGNDQGGLDEDIPF